MTWLEMYTPKECPAELKQLLKQLITDYLDAAVLIGQVPS
jgi:hypothetical protein